MKHATETPPRAAPFQDSDLLRLELLVAKRADRLWRMAGCASGRDLLHWLQAESDILERYFMAERQKSKVLAAAR
jgi:hypothetical protein